MLLRLGRRTSARLVGRHHCTTATLYYQGPEVPRSLTSTGLVGTNRDVQGSDGEFFGVAPTPTVASVRDGRGQPFSLDENGFCRVDHAWAHVDYYDNEAVLGRYYSECEALVARHTGASRVLAFDHNLRARARKAAADSLKGAGANAVQEPLITYGVHNDYTLASAPRRIEQLSQPLGPNDTLRVRLEQGASSPIAADEVERLLSGRWQFINVWRNVSPEPVARAPLALCDAQSVSADDLVVFEIRYVDRVGENYFAAHRPEHAWWYFPQLTRDEAVLIKCWDSRGADFRGKLEAARGLPPLGEAEPSVRATFSLHSGFEDPATPEGAPDRESIEVRCVAFF